MKRRYVISTGSPSLERASPEHQACADTIAIVMLAATCSTAVSARHQLGMPDQRPPHVCRRGVEHRSRSIMVVAASAPADAGRLAMQCRQFSAADVGEACALPRRQRSHLRHCHSSASPVRLHARARHHTAGGMHSSGGGGSSSRRLHRHPAATATVVRVHLRRMLLMCDRRQPCSSANSGRMVPKQCACRSRLAEQATLPTMQCWTAGSAGGWR